MKILVINAGSSSLKYQLFDMKDESVLCSGIVERIGLNGSRLVHKAQGKKYTIESAVKDHKIALKLVLDILIDKEKGVIKSMDEINAVGHRVVHGGETFSGSVLIDEKVMKALEDNIELAPLHNPPNIMGIRAAKELLPDVPHVGTFDTAFHQTLSKKAYLYAIPLRYYTKYKIRRYGFHGTSHFYVSHRTAEILNKPVEEMKIITCHIGNGSSVAAVKYGKSVDTSMGFTPLEGLVMGTRSGDLDPAIVTFLQEKENLSYKEINSILNKESGAFGLSNGLSSDMRDIENAALEDHNDAAKMALDIYDYRIAKYVGAYAAAMNGVDAITFTAGVGENSAYTRADVCSYLEFLGLKVDPNKNNIRGKEAIISTDDSKVKVLVVPTNEELVIARDTQKITQNIKK
ncbi:acetate kinase [Athalassotoga sp.]|uniref:acetate kinase n=1 Tax=Athalassotoga sp. TaxID=2022597 RepID=UPI003D00D48A